MADQGIADPGTAGDDGMLRRGHGFFATAPQPPSLSSPEVMAFRKRAAEMKSTSEEVFEEASALLGLAEKMRSIPGIDAAKDRIDFIFECLCAEKPKLTLARDERLRLHAEVYRHSGPITRTLARISAGSSVGLVLTALVASFAVWVTLFLILRALNLTKISPYLFMDGPALAVVAFAALIGGILSIATRLREFSRVRDIDPFAMFWTALLKPLIGVVLAVFMLAALGSGIVSFKFLALGSGEPFKSVDNTTLYSLWVIGFLAGFSERFAWDFIERAQGIANGGKKQK